jgi:hypothetical protein
LFRLPTRYKFIERFWSKVKKCEGCWEWTGHLTPGGYGRMRIGDGRRRGAHQISWMIHFGSIPDGLSVLHHCDNPRCVRPDHLFLGTQQDNLSDMRAKGRQRWGNQMGENNGRARLTVTQVRTLRSRWIAGERNEALAAEFGLSVHYARRIIYGYVWRKIDLHPKEATCQTTNQ